MAFSVISRVKAWPRRRLILVAIAAVGVVMAARIFLADEEVRVAPERQVPVVRAQALGDLQKESAVPYQGVFEAASSARLVARSGGRVTAVRHELGEKLRVGQVVVEIDGGSEVNVSLVQVAGLTRSLDILSTSEKAALAAADIGIELAESNLRLASATSPTATEGAAVARRQADLAVRAAELALEDARNVGVDAAIRAADVAAQNAGFAQDQATLNRRLATSQQKISLPQAQLGVANARQGKESTAAQLASARQQLVTQLDVAQAQVRAQHVAAPLSGELTALRVHVGDFVQPGEDVGEVNALLGAIVRLHVPAGVRDRVVVGSDVRITHERGDFSGIVREVASAPSSSTALWQLEVHVAATPFVIHPGEIVSAHLPVGATLPDTYFLPLKAVAIRQEGARIFILDGDSHVKAHEVDIVAFHGDFVEVRLDVPEEARLIIEGNRTLNDGDEVRAAP